MMTTLINPDKWLDANAEFKMPDVLQSLREDYLTFVGPICKDKSPAVIADAVNEAYKSHLKENHQLDKGIATELQSLQSMTDTWFRSIINNMTTEALKVSNIEKSCGDLKRKVNNLYSTILTLKEQASKDDRLTARTSH